MVNDRAWRNGESPGMPFETESEFKSRIESRTPEAIPAAEAGGYVAVRMFFKRNPLVETVLDVIPFGSAIDAVTGLPATIKGEREKQSDGQQLVKDYFVEKVPPGVEHAFFLEREGVHSGESCRGWVVAGNVEEIAFFVSCTHHGDGWTWDAVLEIAPLQAQKIRRAVDGF
jgi:hypothetical protein